MVVKVSWNGPSGLCCRAQAGSGHMVARDGAPVGGGVRGVNILLAPAGLVAALGATVADVTQAEGA